MLYKMQKGKYIRLCEKLQILYYNNMIEFDLTGEKNFRGSSSLSEPHFLNKIAPSEKFCRKICWSRSAEV